MITRSLSIIIPLAEHQDLPLRKERRMLISKIPNISAKMTDNFLILSFMQRIKTKGIWLEIFQCLSPTVRGLCARNTRHLPTVKNFTGLITLI